MAVALQLATIILSLMLVGLILLQVRGEGGSVSAWRPRLGRALPGAACETVFRSRLGSPRRSASLYCFLLGSGDRRSNRRLSSDAARKPMALSRDVPAFVLSGSLYVDGTSPAPQPTKGCTKTLTLRRLRTATGKRRLTVCFGIDESDGEDGVPTSEDLLAASSV